MTPVKPTIFFLGEPIMHVGRPEDPGVIQWLEHIGGEQAVTCLDHMPEEGSDIECLIELLARRCYKSFAPGLNPNVTKVRTDSTEYIKNILNSRHGSVTAHGHVTYAFEDVSRVFTHEIVRNWVGNERSQESLRYVRLTDIRFWIPPIIANETEHKDGMICGNRTPAEIFLHVIGTCEWAQRALAEYYNIENIKNFERKKKLTSAFRRVAPLGLATGIGISFNLRALRWIIEQRTDPAAEEEIRLVFGMLAEDATKRWPMVFQDVEKVDTGDGLFWYKPANSKI